MCNLARNVSGRQPLGRVEPCCCHFVTSSPWLTTPSTGRGAGVSGTLHQFALAERGEYDDGGEALLRDLGRGRDPVELGHPDIEHGQIWAQVVDELCVRGHT